MLIAVAVYVQKLSTNYTTKARTVESLKKEIKTIVDVSMDTLQAITKLDELPPQKDELLANCASKVDNLDLRAEPPICGNVYKDTFRKSECDMSGFGGSNVR